MFEKLTVSSDFTEDEKMEIENIRMYKKDLLEDIQVRQANAQMEQTKKESLSISLLCFSPYRS